MFNKPPAVPSPFWLYYVNVKSIDAATESVKGNGGQVINGPMEVPGGSWIVQCKDPQGAMFALVGPRN
jgi:predicted enzyme related to lactoylglutathione lyase